MADASSWEDARHSGWFIAVVVIGVGAAVAALLPFTVDITIRIIETSAVVAALAFLGWVYMGGYGRAVEQWADWKTRRLIRTHPEMLAALEALVGQIENALGPRHGRFRNAALGVLNEWWRVHQSATSLGGPSPFTDAERQQYEVAQRAQGFYESHVGDWAVVRNLVTYLLSDVARRDGLGFAYAAYLLKGYVSSSLMHIRDFTLPAQQMGLSKIGQIPLGEWSTYATTINTLVAKASEINDVGPLKTGYDLDLRFEPIVENLALARTQA